MIIIPSSKLDQFELSSFPKQNKFLMAFVKSYKNYFNHIDLKEVNEHTLIPQTCQTPTFSRRECKPSPCFNLCMHFVDVGFCLVSSKYERE